MSEKTKNQQRIDDIVQTYLGKLAREEQFENGERVTFEEIVEKHGAHAAMCHNCAFRDDSPEQMHARGNYPAQFWTILLGIRSAVREEAAYAPFFCHRKMPSDDGGKNFQPELDDEGLPAGHKLCAGWTAEVKEQTEFQKRLKDEDDGW